MFTSQEVFPGIFHITDAMGVSFTLLTGSERALLIDTGYGLEDAAAYVRSVTSRPVDVLLTNGHHDHALTSVPRRSGMNHPRHPFRWFPCLRHRKRAGTIMSGSRKSICFCARQPRSG